MTKLFTGEMSRVFVDTSGFKALLDEDDDFHKGAKEAWVGMRGKKLMTSNYVLDESYTLIRVRRNLVTALKLKKLFLNNADQIKVMRVRLEDERKAWDWFEKNWSGLSFTDCVSFVMCERMGIKEVFGYDGHFERAGFELLG